MTKDTQRTLTILIFVITAHLIMHWLAGWNCVYLSLSSSLAETQQQVQCPL